MTEPIFHITTRDAWSAAQRNGAYQADTLASQGFIHCSSREQVIATANTWFRAQTGLVLLEIDPSCLQSEMRWEVGTDKPEECFPHIHGPLNIKAVSKVYDFSPDPDGLFNFPLP